MIFEVNTKGDSGTNSQFDWIVKRFETDFYTLRNILVMYFGQCFIPPLVPTTKESTFDKKSMRVRERSFARFLRGILRSPELSSHPNVVEFLRVDHSKDNKMGYSMKDFTKKLIGEEQKLGSKKPNNTIYSVTYYKERFSFPEVMTTLADIQKGKKKMTEAQFVAKYGNIVKSILSKAEKYQK